MDSLGRKVVLRRTCGADDLWKQVQQHYAGEDPRVWKYLAMFALRETAGWSIDQIAAALGHTPGHISRSLKMVRRELQGRFSAPPGYFDVAREGFSDPGEDPTSFDLLWRDDPDGGPRANSGGRMAESE